MSQIATTIDQSKKLIELGIEVSTADMHYCVYNLDDINELPVLKFSDMTVFEFENTNIVPAWSLSALVELLPDKICINNDTYFIYLNKKEVAYKGHMTWDGQLNKSFKDDNLINACYKMLCYLIESKII